MDISIQAKKYHIGLAGEFLVAAQLHRHNIAASVTYGNAKSADVIAFSPSGEKAVVVEVKTTSQASWVVGGHVPQPSNKPWVFVYLPPDPVAPPSFFVLLQSELHEILMPGHQAYLQRFRERQGEEYGDRPGVVTLKRKDVSMHQDAWQKITRPLTLLDRPE